MNASQTRNETLTGVEENMRSMKTLDDSWNNQDWETFNKRHAMNVAILWPGGADPTMGRHDHEAEAKEFFKTFPDNHVGNDPYRTFFGQADWTCSIADFTGTMKGPMRTADGKMIQPTNKSFHVELCTVAHWKDGEITEERLFYDLVGLMKQIGVI